MQISNKMVELDSRQKRTRCMCLLISFDIRHFIINY